jgi:hypothetical protein
VSIGTCYNGECLRFTPQSWRIAQQFDERGQQTMQLTCSDESMMSNELWFAGDWQLTARRYAKPLPNVPQLARADDIHSFAEFVALIVANERCDVLLWHAYGAQTVALNTPLRVINACDERSSSRAVDDIMSSLGGRAPRRALLHAHERIARYVRCRITGNGQLTAIETDDSFILLSFFTS